jgi:hypothetical protein
MWYGNGIQRMCSVSKWSNDDLTSCVSTTVIPTHTRIDGNAAQVQEFILEAKATLDTTLTPQQRESENG